MKNYKAELVNESGCVFDVWEDAGCLRSIKKWAKGRGGEYTLIVTTPIVDEDDYIADREEVAKYTVRDNRFCLNKWRK